MSSRFVFVALVAVSFVLAQDVPLASKIIPYNSIPYQVGPLTGVRTQTGYNRCNSSTEGPNSLCQTTFLNSLDDFCLWGPADPNSTIGDKEGELVAWCTKPGRGTRIIPAGALTGVQFIQTPAYVQVTGHMIQDLINIASSDSGGEEDPHGADSNGNPVGGLVYSNAFPSNNGNNNTFQQAQEWSNFLGSGEFCFKACDPTGPDAANYCQHIYDLIGCAYNMPAQYQDGVFLKCKGDNQDFPGVYTGADGRVSTYQQPAQVISIPYTPKIPATSDCTTYASADLYAAAARVAPNPNSTAIPKPTVTSQGSAGVTGTRSGSSSGALPSQTASQKSGGQQSVISAVVGLGAAMIGLTLFA